MLPVHKRDFHIFLSHASADKHLVTEFYHWLESAGFRVWFDLESLSGGTAFGSALGAAIPECRAFMVIISKAALASGWVDQECQFALMHEKQFPNFRVIPVVIDESQPPGFLATKNFISMPEGKLTSESADAVLKALSNFNPSIQAALQYGRTKDIYISRTWRDTERQYADNVCQQFAKANFRLIGDALDQSSNNENRIHSIIESCGGLLAVLPHRADGEGHTSPFMLEEIRTAQSLGLVTTIIAEPNVEIPADIAAKAVFSANIPASALDNDVNAAVQVLVEAYAPAKHQQYVFYATNLSSAHKRRNQLIRRLIERVTAMQCVMGEEVEQQGTKSLQQAIVDQIRGSFLMVADISEHNLNTMIEAGVSRGAGVPSLLFSGDERHNPPFMFVDQQVFYYEDELDLLARINRLIYPYRRHVLNYVLGK